MKCCGPHVICSRPNIHVGDERTVRPACGTGDTDADLGRAVGIEVGHLRASHLTVDLPRDGRVVNLKPAGNDLHRGEERCTAPAVERSRCTEGHIGKRGQGTSSRLGDEAADEFGVRPQFKFGCASHPSGRHSIQASITGCRLQAIGARA